MADYTKIDMKEYYEKECQPLVNELCKKCSLAGIPIFISAAVQNDENGTVYKNDGILTGSRNIKLKTDQIKFHMMVSGGCKAIPIIENEELTIDNYLDDIDDIQFFDEEE